LRSFRERVISHFSKELGMENSTPLEGKKRIGDRSLRKSRETLDWKERQKKTTRARRPQERPSRRRSRFVPRQGWVNPNTTKRERQDGEIRAFFFSNFNQGGGGGGGTAREGRPNRFEKTPLKAPFKMSNIGEPAY